MQNTQHVNVFAAMKLEKQVKIAKGKEALQRRVKQLRSEQRRLQPLTTSATTIY